MKSKRTVIYYLCILAVLLIAFFTNDFNLVNVQKTAIVTAIGIDKEGADFSLTAVIASPSSQGPQSGKNGDCAALSFDCDKAFRAVRFAVFSALWAL